MKMVRRIVKFSAERRQVFKSLAYLSSTERTENVHTSMRSYDGNRESVFRRLGPVQRKKDVPQAFVRQGATNPKRTVRSDVKDKRLAVLSTSYDLDLEDSHGEDLRQKLNRMRKAREQVRDRSPLIKNPEVKFKETVNDTVISNRKYENQSTPTSGTGIEQLQEKRTFHLPEKPHEVTTSVCVRHDINITEKKEGGSHGCYSNDQGKGRYSRTGSSRSDRRLCHERVHWKAKSEKHHDEFQKESKFQFLQRRRTSGEYTVQLLGKCHQRAAEITMHARTRVSCSELQCRKRKAPSQETSATPAKRRRTIG